MATIGVAARHASEVFFHEETVLLPQLLLLLEAWYS
jgi:hypothetical protein